MLRRELAIFFLVVCFILACVPDAFCRSSPPTIYVAGDGSGDYNCDGKSDQVQINQALQFVAINHEYTTVHLKGPFTYVIDDTILIGSNTILEGDSSAVIKLTNHAGWPTMKALIEQMSSEGNSDITIRGFEVNGNYAGNREITLGRGFYNVMHFINSTNIKVYDMYMHDGTGDGLRLNRGKNIQFYNNKVYKLGHDGFFAIGCENVEAWNNRITCRTNGGLRIWNSKNVKFYDNAIDSFYHWSAGGSAIQIEKSTGGTVRDVEAYNNTINNTYGPGIWIIGYGEAYPREEAQNVNIHNNIIFSTGTNPSISWVGGIVTCGFYDTVIENNVFDGIYHAAIIAMYPADHADLAPQGTGYNTIVRNNIIVNTQKRTKNPAGTGCGIANYLPETHIFTLESNCFYNNIGNNYKNCASTKDIYVTPLFTDQKNHDYHLQSAAGSWNGKTWVIDKVSSTCIDAGYRYSEYSKEPEPNGGRINIGPDGNTIYASKSESIVPTPNPPDASFNTPVASFNSAITTGPAPLSVAFTDKSSDSTTSWTWNFGDGTSSTIKNPVHSYSKTGKYTVSLTVENAAGSNTLTKPNYIVVTGLKAPSASFYASSVSGKAPLTVRFTDKSTGSPASWSWNFGDKTTSSASNPVHKYSKAGKYTVSLTVKNVAGSNSATRSGYIKVK